MSDLDDILAKAQAAMGNPNPDGLPTEIQHPTDLIGISPYYELVMLLILLDVVPNNVHLSTSSYWDDYGY